MKTAGVEKELGSSHVLSFIAARENTGEYICEAQNPHGAMNSTIQQITVPGISFTAFLSILAALTVLIFALLTLLILMLYRRSEERIKSETNQDQSIYANVSASAAKSQQPESKPCDNEDIGTVNPTFRQHFSNENIYANCEK
ncbi:hypothetical protein QQF64_011862 [Cirrhinus molitorella]|uniref:Uncharacterized protein n=1 Tax=Cirrhinus molitorella TaxID=172907 RepID=A0ABR3LXG1_9TELE